ncbi:Venom metalloproteinase antarease-like [Orchesella cincta]|uniref:Venom metalloproteinase antarease-like n=1 Tax=Orchesella cincta TaxID=48709 RepID=A0A1D2M4U1_ORCCI|nr:Venom metalloproteinase antarease-like [Orchesella cincta]
MSKSVTLVGFLLALAWPNPEKSFPNMGSKVAHQSTSRLTLKQGQYKLKLSKPDKSVLHPNIKVITVGTDAETGHDTYDYWTPSKNELNAAEDVYVDEKNLAAVRVNYDNGDRSMIGVVNGKSPIKQSSPNAAANDAVAEILVVCDKEFGDVFQHDRVKILDYLTVYFWDVNLRYKTLPSINLTFRVTGVVVISTPSGQPFIEEARAPDGRAEFGRILNRFSYWVYQQMSVVPKFDMAVAITNTALEWGGGLASANAACWVDNTQKRHVGTLVFNDGGDWGSLTVGTHEMAHTLGAPHDDDPNFPGGCTERGYIMGGGNDDLRWFFPLAVTADIADCKVMKCRLPGDSRIFSFPPVDNSPCGGQSRCFRGRCRMPGSLIRNVGDGRCLKATDPFAFTAPLEPVNCPRPGTPLDRFVISDDGIGKTLATPWETRDAKETGDKCIYS